MSEVETIIIGAGPAGLACAGALKMRGREALVLEKGQAVGSVWRGHYDRLHLHTAKRYSGLPGYPMPKDYPRYPSRDQVVAYLEDYARHHGLAPRFGCEVTEIRRGQAWEVATSAGDLCAEHVIVAGGVASSPYRADFEGMDGFEGAILHSSDYANPFGFSGQRVLVVGFGNSAGEIALDLASAGIETDISVRGPVNVIPRDVFGIPAQSFSVVERHLPYKLVDLLNGSITRLRMGDITKLGLEKSPKGPIAQIVEDGRVPLIDIGTVAAIRDGLIKVRPGISRFEQDKVQFVDGQSAVFDAVILATGYKPDLSALLPECSDALKDGAPRLSGAKSGSDRLWFCGYNVVPTGHLREIAIEAEAIAARIAG